MVWPVKEIRIGAGQTGAHNGRKGAFQNQVSELPAGNRQLTLSAAHTAHACPYGRQIEDMLV